MMIRLADAPHQTDASQQLQEIIAKIDFPPEEALVGGALIAVVVVVPAFAEGREGHPQVVAALVGSGVPPTPEEMTHRVDRENRVV